MDNNAIAILERNVLGTMLVEPYLLKDTELREEHFSSQTYKNIFAVMKALAAKGKPIDVFSIDPTGEHLSELANIASYANNVKFNDWEQILLEAFQKREYKNILRNAAEVDWEIEETITALSNLNRHNSNNVTDFFELAKGMMNMPYDEKPFRNGIKTGLKDFDTLTSGFVNGELIIVAARPSVGKTQIMINFAIGATKHNENVIALIFSLEMTEKALAGRFICNIGQINQYKLNDPYRLFKDGQKEKWPTIVGEFSKLPILISDKSNQTVAQMRATIRKTMMDNPSKQVVVFVDYLTKIKSNDTKAPRYIQVGQISNDLKIIARDFDIPVVCLAQLNREIDTQKEKRPMLSHLRDSGDIEQDADIVVLLHRDSYQNEEQQDNKVLELIIAKNRNGQVGKVFTEFTRETGRITNASNS